MFDKSISYDHGDYKMTLDGRYIGHRATYHDAEVALDQTVFEMLTHGDFATATELDGDPPGDNPLGDDEGDTCPDEYRSDFWRTAYAAPRDDHEGARRMLVVLIHPV